MNRACTMIARRRAPWRRWPAAAIAAAVAVVAVAGCAPSGPRGELTLPPRLAGLPRFVTLSDEDARELIARFHGRSVAPVESRLALYGISGKHVVLFIARYPNARDSGEQLAAMAAKIGADSGLHDHERFTVDGIPTHAWVGHGLRHYAFARGAQLVWLAAPAQKSRSALAQVLRVGIDAVPASAAP